MNPVLERGRSSSIGGPVSRLAEELRARLARGVLDGRCASLHVARQWSTRR